MEIHVWTSETEHADKTFGWFYFAFFSYIPNMQIKFDWYKIKPFPSVWKLGLPSQPQTARKKQKQHVGNFKETKATANLCISWFSGDGASQTSQDVSNA